MSPATAIQFDDDSVHPVSSHEAISTGKDAQDGIVRLHLRSSHLTMNDKLTSCRFLVVTSLGPEETL